MYDSHSYAHMLMLKVLQQSMQIMQGLITIMPHNCSSHIHRKNVLLMRASAVVRPYRICCVTT